MTASGLAQAALAARVPTPDVGVQDCRGHAISRRFVRPILGFSMAYAQSKSKKDALLSRSSSCAPRPDPPVASGASGTTLIERTPGLLLQDAGLRTNIERPSPCQEILDLFAGGDRRRFRCNSGTNASRLALQKRRCAHQTRRTYSRHYDRIAPLV